MAHSVLPHTFVNGFREPAEKPQWCDQYNVRLLPSYYLDPELTVLCRGLLSQMLVMKFLHPSSSLHPHVITTWASMCLEHGPRSTTGLPPLMEYPNGGILPPRSTYSFAMVLFTQPVSICFLS